MKKKFQMFSTFFSEPSSPPLEEAVLNFEKLFLRPLKASLSRKKIKHEQLSRKYCVRQANQSVSALA